MNRRIFFIAPSAYPLGGVQTWLDTTMLELRNRGWDPVLGLVCGRFHNPDVYLHHHPWPDVVLIENRTGSQMGRVRAIRDAIIEANPDIVAVANVADSYEAFCQLPRAMREHKRLVMTLHGLESTQIMDARRVGLVCDAIICTNRLTESLLRTCPDAQQTTVMYAPYGVGEGRKAQKNSASGVLKILFAARLENSQKRIFDLLPLIQELEQHGRQFELTIAGDGPDRATLQMQLEPYIKSGRVTMTGFVPRGIVLTELLPAADVFLVTSEWETGPISIWEAMASGVPVVTSKYIGYGLEGALQHDVNCLMYETGNMLAAAGNLDRLCTMPGLGQRITDEATKLVMGRYSLKASADAWESCLIQVIAQTSRQIPFSEIPASVARRSGRLDHLFGPSLGESIRSLSGRRFQHEAAGDEWPAFYGGAESELCEPLADAAALESECI